MARKGWSQLSDAYRARLERGGISRSDYEGGAKLQKARGQAKAEPRRVRKPAKWIPAGVGESAAYAMRKRALRMGLDDVWWKWGLSEFTWAEIEGLLRWKIYAHNKRNEGNSMRDGTIDPPPGTLSLRFDPKNPWFWYGW